MYNFDFKSSTRCLHNCLTNPVCNGYNYCTFDFTVNYYFIIVLTFSKCNTATRVKQRSDVPYVTSNYTF